MSAESGLLISSDTNGSRTDTGLGCSGFSLMLPRVIKFSPAMLLGRCLDCTGVNDFSSSASYKNSGVFSITRKHPQKTKKNKTNFTLVTEPGDIVDSASQISLTTISSLPLDSNGMAKSLESTMLLVSSISMISVFPAKRF